MTLQHRAIIEFAFFQRSSFQRFTSPHCVFVLENCENAPPALSLYFQDDDKVSQESDAHWFIYDESKIDWGSYYEQFAAPSPFHERLLAICLLMIAIFVAKDDDTILVADSFSKDMGKKGGYFDLYKELNDRQIDFLTDMAKQNFPANILSFRIAGRSISFKMYKKRQPICNCSNSDISNRIISRICGLLNC